MNTRTDLETELKAQLQVGDNSTLFPSSRITTLIKNAYMWATQLYIWVDLVKAKCTSTYAGQEYYDYPEDFRSGTIVLLTVDGEPYENKNFKDYQLFKYENPSSTEKIFANFGRQFFIHPTPSTTGSNNIIVYGAVQAEELDESTDETIFSGNKESANECVVKKALSVAVKNTDQNLSVKEEKDAIAILGKLNADEWKSSAMNQKMTPMLNIPDFFSNQIGGVNNFSIRR